MIFLNPKWDFFRKNSEKNSEENLKKGDPNLKKTYLGPKEKIFKKKLIKKSCGIYMVYIIDLFFQNFYTDNFSTRTNNPQGEIQIISFMVFSPLCYATF